MDYYYFLLFVLVTPLFFFLFQWYMKAGWGRNRPPGPPGLPFIGNLHQLDSSPLYHQLWKLSIKYGPLVSLQFGFTPVLVVSSPKMAKEALKTHDAEFADRPPFVSFKKLSYNGLDVAFAPYNDSWKEMRKICILHLFSPKRVQSFHPVREEEVSKMIKKIENCASDSRIVNLSEMLLLLANTNICRIAFGKNYDDDNESSERSKFENLLSDSQAVSAKLYLSDYFPYLGWVDRLTGESGRLEKTFKELDAFLQQLVDEHISDEKRSNKFGQNDFIDVLLQLKKDGSSTINLTFDHIKAILLDIFTAGTDTNTATLVWAMTELIKNPNTMKKAQQEVRNIARNNGAIKENDLQKCPYLQAVVKETMRLHPPAPLLVPHQTTQKCNIFGYEIPPKTVVHVNAWAIGRDPESWEDPERFFPERFLGNSIDFRGRDFELIPFGAGRRGCPGIHMGVVTVEFALANLLYYFNWELPDGMKREQIDTDVKPGITMHKKNPLCLIARKWSGNLDE